jgi:hypothetical protein
VAQVQVQPQGAIQCGAHTEAMVHQQAAIQCDAVHSKHNRPAGKDPVWLSTVELARVARGESGARVSHAQIGSPVRGSAWWHVKECGGA